MLHLPNVTNPHIYVFGAGGTGGFALEFMSRLFANSSQRVTIDIFDGDNVENKNLKRQNFGIDDLDKNKAEALIEHFNRQVTTPPKFRAHTQYVTDADELGADVLSSLEDDETAIFVLAVDNISTRRLVNTVMQDLKEITPIIALDSGNDNQGGQVVVYANQPVKSRSILNVEQMVQLQTMLQLYPEIDIIKDGRDENPGLVSYCADESNDKPQSMMANVQNGEILASLVYQISQNQSLPYNVWHQSVITTTINGEIKGLIVQK